MSSQDPPVLTRRRRSFPRPVSLWSTILNRYLLVELFPPLSLGLFVVTFTLLMISLLPVMDELLLSGAPLWPMLKFLACLLPSLLTMALPIGCLLSSMLVYGRLGEDRELVAMRAAGMSGIALIVPAYFVGICLTAFNLYWTTWITPKSLDILHQSTQEILEQMTTVNVFKPGQFNSLDDVALYCSGMPAGTNTLQKVMIFKSAAESGVNWFGEGATKQEASNWTVSAPTATLVPDPAHGILRLTLQDCVSEDLRPPTLRRVFIDELTVSLNIAERLKKITGGRISKDMKSMAYYLTSAASQTARYRQLVAHMKAPPGIPPENRQPIVDEIIESERKNPTPHRETRRQAEELIAKEIEEPGYLRRNEFAITRTELELIDKEIMDVQKDYNRAMLRLAYPMGTFLFMMIGCPLGILTGRGKKTVCLLITVGVLLIYYSLEKVAEAASETIAMSSHFDPGFIVWIPNLLLFLIGAILLRVACKN